MTHAEVTRETLRHNINGHILADTFKMTGSLWQLASPAPYGVRLPCGDHWTLTGPARRNDTPTSAVDDAFLNVPLYY